MSLKEMKDQSFPHHDYDEWKKTAEESLKGKTLESLQRTTYENIVLKPLYTSNDAKGGSEFPGGSDFRRGINSTGYLTNTWKVAQRLSYETIEELKDKLKLALESGQTALSFELNKELVETRDILADAVKKYYSDYPLAINAKQYLSELMAALELLSEDPGANNQVTGYAAADPLAAAALEGSLSEEVINDWSKTIIQAAEKFPQLKTILVDTTPYHNGGANAVQELAIAAATGVFYLQNIGGLSLEQILDKMIFKFSIGSNFFMEIAKLRAARMIWNKITEVYGAGEEARGMQIAAETSPFTKTVFDPYVNLLRGGNEAFAAVVGGVQYLHVHAFDELTGSSQFSERIARNIQLILKEEAHLQKVIDPAGGSWYVEALTGELADKAWKLFQTIEANGGIVEVLKTGWLQEKISAVFEKRQNDIFTRKQSIVGTNVYANLDDAVPELAQNLTGAGTQYIQPIPQLRLSHPYEMLRKQADSLKQKLGLKPSVGLLCLGSLKEYKARMDFVRGFVSAGGVTVIPSEPIQTADEAKQFVSNAKSKHFCICGTNDAYETLGIEVLKAIKAEYPDRTVYLAGLPGKEDQAKWQENGLKQFIHVKSNCFETLSTILTEMEVSINEQVQA